MTEVLQQVAQHAGAHTNQKLLIVGHTDKTGSDQYNQSLSERRARSVFAYLSFNGNQATSEAEWNELRQRGTGNRRLKDNWGTRQYQYMLQDLGFYSGNVDGDHGPMTDEAVRSFRADQGLPAGTTVDDLVWAALIHEYMALRSLAVPDTQFLANAKDACSAGIIKWLGCGEESPLPLPQPPTEDPHRQYRRVELLFVPTDRLSCDVKQPETFDLPAPGAVNNSWCLASPTASRRCCFATRDCATATAGQWCITPAEPGSFIVRGSLKFEDGTPAVNVNYVLIAPDGEFMDGEALSGVDRGDGIRGRTRADGTFEYTSKPKGPGIFTIEVKAPFVARLAPDPPSTAKGNVICQRLTGTGSFDVILSQRQVGNRVEVIVLIQEGDTDAATPLTEAWVYWREAGHLVLLRTDETGRLFAQIPESDRTQPESYTRRFTTLLGIRVGIYFSRGVVPLPDFLLQEPPDPFIEVIVTAATPIDQDSSSTFSDAAFFDGPSAAPADAGPAPIPTSTSAGTATVPNLQAQLTKPTQLSIWPLLWDLPSDTYHLSELTQGAAMWRQPPGATSESPRPVAADLTLTENSASPALSAAAAALVRPKERGLNVEGTIDQQATGVKIRVLDAAGNIIQLRQNQSATTGVQEIVVTPGAVIGNVKPFSAAVFFLDAVNAFGPVQIAITSVGVTPTIIATFAVHLAGLQVALVNDTVANTNGQQPGSVLSESDERIIVDFLLSPQNDAPAAPLNALIAAQTRARRMIAYQLANRSRALDLANAVGANNPAVLRPEMPMWMAEIQLVGLNRTQLEALMLRRKNNLAGSPTSLAIALDWRLHLEWDGPDSDSGSPRLFRHSENFPLAAPDTRTATLNLDAANLIDGVDAQGRVANAITPAPVTPTFPVAGRRAPQVIVSGQSRAWGRQSGATSKDTLIIEWQPEVVDNAREVMRGGDGNLSVNNISIAGARIDVGVVLSGSPSTPDLKVPTFRVLGLNPGTRNDVIALVNGLVVEFFNTHLAQARVALLPLAVWQDTARRIVFHESVSTNQPGHDFGHQFEFRGAGRRRFSGQFFGHEQDMPIFGAPHGYGFGQLDNPPISPDQGWSFLENIKETVRRIMQDKAAAAFNHLTLPAAGAPATAFSAFNLRRRRAMFRREVVRRYNGGVEFQFEAGAWVIHTGVPAARQGYPNTILGTTVVYPGPTNFDTADFGPGI
jgi:hypothetical protein